MIVGVAIVAFFVVVCGAKSVGVASVATVFIGWVCLFAEFAYVFVSAHDLMVSWG